MHTHWTRSRAATCAAMCAVALAAIACGGDDATPTNPLSPVQVAGVYSLRTIGGQALPATAGGTDLVQSDVFNLQADGTFTQLLKHQPDGPTGRPVTAVALGRWTLSGSTVAFTYTSPTGSLTGTTSDGQTLTVSMSAGVYVYSK